MLSHLLGAQAAPSKRNLKLLRHSAGIAWPGDHHIEVRFHESLCCQEIRLGISTRSVEDDQNSPCHTRDRWADGKSWMRSKLNMAAGQGSKNGSVRSGAPWKTMSQMCLQVNPAEIKQVPGHAVEHWNQEIATPKVQILSGGLFPSTFIAALCGHKN